MKVRIYIVLLLSAMFSGSFAQQLTESEARENVLDFLSESTARHSKSKLWKDDASPSLVYSSPNLYAYDVGECFVLAGGNMQMPAIMGYSDRSNFGEAFQNECFRALIRHISADYNPDFRIYKPANVADFVEPLCHDTWHQYSPFNDLTPVVDGQHCVTGCVAISMSEFMQYYKYPSQGTGFYEYNDSNGCGQIVSSEFSSHIYDWPNILDDYGYEGSVSYTEAQARAVALLSYDCGVSVGMKYKTDASGAQTIRQPIALVNYFGYDEGMQMYYRNFFNQCEWDSIMFNELNEGRPILVGGWSQTLGHSYLCDGYDSNGFFHLRLGNPLEDATGYYYFTWSTPLQPEWYDINTGEGGFNLLQSILVGAKPKTSSSPSPQRYIYAFSHIAPIGTDTLTVQKEESFNIAVYNLCNCGWNVHEGTVGLALKKKNEGRETSIDNTTLLYRYSRLFSLEELTDSTYSDTIMLCIPNDISEGNYRIVPVYEENGKYIEARTMVGMPNSLSCEIKSESVFIYSPEEDHFSLRLTDIHFPTEIYRYDKPQFDYKVTNNGAEYSGRIFTCLYKEGSPEKLYYFNRQGVSIDAGETQTYKFAYTNISQIPAGYPYHLIIYADIDLFTDSMIVLYEDPVTNIRILNGSSTSIDNVTQSESDFTNRYYDLSGRRISDVSTLPNRSIYIEILADGSRRKLIK